MANIFLSYRRSDGPQASRLYERLIERFGRDAVYMDVTNIPFGVDFPEHIRDEIAHSGLMLVLIGDGWLERALDERDFVRMELEEAVARNVPLLPLLIGNAVMPRAEDLPVSIASLGRQNAQRLGELRDFHAHIQTMLPHVDAALAVANRSALASVIDPRDIALFSGQLVATIAARYYADAENTPGLSGASWHLYSPGEIAVASNSIVSMYVHRIVRVRETIDLHTLFTFWGRSAEQSLRWAGWLLDFVDHNPVLQLDGSPPAVEPAQARQRASDEDPRQIWKMISDRPLQLSLAFVANIVAA